MMKLAKEKNGVHAFYYSFHKLLSSRLFFSKKADDQDIGLTYKAIIFPFMLNGYETWSLILRKEHELQVFGSEVHRKIFGSKKARGTNLG
jgi:hypothetical protein